MSQDDVLAKVEAARHKVAQTIEHAQAGRDQVQELLKETGEHFSTLSDDFNTTLTHFQAEATRARDLAQQVIEALLKAAQEATQAAQDNRQGLHSLTQSAHDATAHNDSGTSALETHSGQVADRKSATEALFASVGEQTEAARQNQHQGLDGLATAIGNWTNQTQTKSQEQHSATDSTVQQIAEQHVPEFKQGAQQSVDTARAALEEEQTQLEQQSAQHVEQLRSDREQARSEMESMLNDMGQALDKLSELATSTADTLTKGADEAKDLMSMTNVGVKTVIGLIDNLQQIFNEIESAWS